MVIDLGREITTKIEENLTDSWQLSSTPSFGFC
jgi:hypothetical protein